MLLDNSKYFLQKDISVNSSLIAELHPIERSMTGFIHLAHLIVLRKLHNIFINLLSSLYYSLLCGGIARVSTCHTQQVWWKT